MRTEKESTRSNKESFYPNFNGHEAQRVRIGLVDFNPLRIVGCQVAFDPASDFEVVVTNIAGLLLDRSLALGVLGYGLKSLCADMALLRRMRPELKLIVLGTGVNSRRDASLLRNVPHSSPPSSCLHETCAPRDLRRVVQASLAVAGHRAYSARNDGSDGANPESFLHRSRLRSMQITRREQQVLDQLAQAGSNREIADNLGIEERTVKGHVARLMRKAGVDNRTSLSLYALQLAQAGGGTNKNAF